MAGDQVQQFGVPAEEVLPDLGALRHVVPLHFAVQDLVHPLPQEALRVGFEQRVPVAAPDHLDHVPAGAAEGGLELLHDLAVAAHRAVQPLQVAVDDEDEVAQLFARGQGDRAQGLRLIHLAVAQQGPHLAAAGGAQAAVDQVVVEACLVDGAQRGQAHRDGGELPELRHQERVRVAREAAVRVQFVAEVGQVLLAEAPLQKRAGVQSRRGVPLEEDLVAQEVLGARAPEVVEADLPQRGRRGVGRDVPADARPLAVGPDDHRHGVPADDRLDAPLQLAVARVDRLLRDRDGVDVRRVGGERDADAALLGARLQHPQQLADPVGALLPQYIIERLAPLGVLDLLQARQHLGILDGHGGLLLVPRDTERQRKLNVTFNRKG